MSEVWRGDYGEHWTRERQALELERHGWPVKESQAETQLRTHLLKNWPLPENKARNQHLNCVRRRTLARLPSFKAMGQVYARTPHRATQEGI